MLGFNGQAQEELFMQLNITTDYAIRTVLYLARQREQRTSFEISQAMRIPQDYVLTLTKRLRTEGIIGTQRGNKGGYFLKRKPCDISLYDIINAMEGTTRINRCLEEDRYCSMKATESCPVRCYYQTIQKMFDDAMKGITMETLINK
jgi:Rrf2 family nitric oxide-sensitive transcriptional repressor